MVVSLFVEDEGLVRQEMANRETLMLTKVVQCAKMASAALVDQYWSFLKENPNDVVVRSVADSVSRHSAWQR